LQLIRSDLFSCAIAQAGRSSASSTLVWQNPDDLSWAVAYFLLGPFACAIWMVFICHWRSI
jgi:hypothetical protein